ncbi:MAG: hypothetical protein ACR2K6_08245 [Solirubrobacterales bacterium]
MVLGDRGIGRSWRCGRPLGAACLVLLLSLLVPAAASAQGEGPDFAKTSERDDYIVSTPEFQARLQQQQIDGPAESAAIQAEEAIAGPDARNFAANVCQSRSRECAGDVRLYDWAENGFGNSTEFNFGARDGATISGRVWATEEGPAKRPAVVITTGSVQAPENLYWSFAQVLAKRGYVVITYDVQGQGRSDTFGEAPDVNEGVPSQAGQPFYDGTEDALDFLLSTPSKPYVPRESCGNANGGIGTSHAAKHDRRVDLGLNAAFNPFWELIDSKRIGIAGHSLGAGAVSYIGQLDDRVDAIVAWDNLRAGGEGGFGNAPECPSGSSPRPAEVPITKPAIGMSNDYGLFTDSNFEGDPNDPNDGDPQAQNQGFIGYKEAGVDSMQVNRRGGTHYEYSFIPGETVPPLGLATLRGNDMAVWYTFAWLDKYVRCQGDAECEAKADRRLLTNRWRNDAREGQVDYAGDPNMYSSELASRLDFTDVSGSEQICDDLRAGCANLEPDGDPAGYDFVAETKTLDQPPGGGAGGGGSGGDGGSAGGTGGGACAIGQTGTDADDSPRTLRSTDGGDAIRGRGGDDRLVGGAGDDCLYGNGGDDLLKGQDGDDEVRGGSGSDRAVGGDGEDKVQGSKGRDRVKGKAGDDKVKGGAGKDRVSGGPGEDRLLGGSGNDVIRAADGEADVVICNKGNRDKVVADRIDRVGKACDKIRYRKR